MLEKRKFVRLKAPIGVTYKLIKKHRKQRSHSSFIEDLSAGGLSLTVKEDLRQGDLLEMTIQIPHLREAVQAIGEVAWIFPSRKIGVRFRDVESSDLKHVLEYIHAVGIG